MLRVRGIKQVPRPNFIHLVISVYYELISCILKMSRYEKHAYTIKTMIKMMYILYRKKG